MLPKRNVGKAVAVAVILLALLAVIGFVGYRAAERSALYPLKYTDEVERWAAEYEIDPYLVYAVIRTESSFDPKAESGAGARGLMQMTEDTFDWVKSKIAPQEALTWDDLYDPDTAIRFGAYYLDISLERYGGDPSTAAAAYHSGWGTVDGLLTDSQYTDDGVVLTEFPYPQMAHYVNKVNKSHAKYLSLYGDD